MASTKDKVHKVTLTITSEGQGDNVKAELKFTPNMTSDDLVNLGYQPASHVFTESWLLPMLESAVTFGAHAEMGNEPQGGVN